MSGGLRDFCFWAFGEHDNAVVLEQSQLMQVVAKTPTMCAIWCTDTCCTCRSFLHSCLISFIFALGSLKVIVSKSMMNPRYSILCVALQSDFSILTTKPRDFSRFLDNWRLVVPLLCICLWSANCPGSWLFSVVLSGDLPESVSWLSWIHEGLWLAQTVELCIYKGCLSTRSEDTSDELGEREWAGQHLSGWACT